MFISLSSYCVHVCAKEKGRAFKLSCYARCLSVMRCLPRRVLDDISTSKAHAVCVDCHACYVSTCTPGLVEAGKTLFRRGKPLPLMIHVEVSRPFLFISPSFIPERSENTVVSKGDSFDSVLCTCEAPSVFFVHRQRG